MFESIVAFYHKLRMSWVKFRFKTARNKWVYLDDERKTPEGWVRTYSVAETIELIKSQLVEKLSLDNDLGDLDPKSEGFNVLLWLEQECYADRSFPIPAVFIHSANPVRRDTMLRTIAAIERRRDSIAAGSIRPRNNGSTW
jgi:hypothetical protein